MFQDLKDNEECEYALDVNYAWSAYGCLIDGYPQQFAETCITLSDACKEDNVCAEIETEEYGMCFEEKITCNKNGIVSVESNDMPIYICKNCGEKMSISSNTDFGDIECYGCGKSGADNFIKCEE